MARKPKAYALMWMTGDTQDSLMAHTLVYKGGEGGVRTYLKGHLDQRAGDEAKMPRLDTYPEAIAFFAANRGEAHKALVEVGVAEKIRSDTYAEPV